MEELNRAQGFATECVAAITPEVKPLLRECYYRLGEYNSELAFFLFVPDTEEHREVGKGFCSRLLVALFSAFRTPYVFVASEGTSHWPYMHIKTEFRAEVTQQACQLFCCPPHLLSTVAGWYLLHVFEELLSQRHQHLMSADAIMGSFMALFENKEKTT